MKSLKKTLSTVGAATAMAAVGALASAPVASAASVNAYVPGAHTVVVASKANPALKTQVKRTVYASVRSNTSYAWSYAWTTSNRCTIVAAATLKPVPASAWAVVCR